MIGILEKAQVRSQRELTRGEREGDDPEMESLVRETVERIADRRTMLALETLEEHGRVRFTRLGELIVGVSQKTPTKTLRQMEAVGLVVLTVHPVAAGRIRADRPSRSLSEAFCAAVGRKAPGGGRPFAAGVRSGLGNLDAAARRRRYGRRLGGSLGR